MEKRPLQKIAPAPVANDLLPPTPPILTSVSSRQNLTKHACTACRSRKTKCDGKQPACSRCLKYNVECKYDVSGGQDGLKMQSLRQEVTSLRSKLEDLEILVHTMRDSYEAEAASILARLRSGEPIHDITAALKSSASASAQESVNSSSDQVYMATPSLSDPSFDQSSNRPSAPPSQSQSY